MTKARFGRTTAKRALKRRQSRATGTGAEIQTETGTEIETGTETETGKAAENALGFPRCRIPLSLFGYSPAIFR
jgi:hypothetical protein